MADTRELLFARVVARLVRLRSAGVLREPFDFALAPRPKTRATAALLWDWSRLLGDAHELIGAVFEPALREPGRLHQRRASELRGRPRGAVHWPRTAQLALARPPAGALRFVCTTAERNLLAPENLLLVWTLDEFLARGLALTARVEHSRLISADDRELFRRHRGSVQRALAAPWVHACREAIRGLRRAGTRAEAELEQAVRARVRGRPSAAPDWARELLELRRAPLRVPSREALDEIDVDALWEKLGTLELLSVLRRATALCQHGGAFTCPRGSSFAPAEDDAPVWLLRVPGRPSVGVLRTRATSWPEVRRDALYWSWTARCDGDDIDRWIIVHRAEHGAHDGPEHERRRGDIELLYWRLRADESLGPRLTHELARWTADHSGI